MSAGAVRAPELDRTALRSARRSFYELNRRRTSRVYQVLTPRQQPFLDLLPLLFHVNHPLLPGFVTKDTPYGVSHYRPPRRATAAARRLARSFQAPRRAPLEMAIQGIYLMGSAGTVAQARDSDLDVWVCHDPRLTPAGRWALREKADRIQGWAATLGLDVHFFVIDPAQLAAGPYETVSTHSSGGVQPTLVLDEFYRTAILLAGRHPLWWVVPPHEEDNYTACARKLLDQRFVRAHDVIDFGGVGQIPPDEFLGATLWQTYKAADAPYKSTLKLLLMEAYASEFPTVTLLSHRLKQAVYKGETDTDALDPYILMSTRVEEYLTQRREPERLELARRCLYFKINEPLTRNPAYAAKWRQDSLAELVKHWGWSEAHLLMLDTRSGWKIDRVLEERELLAKELQRSYHILDELHQRYGDGTTEDAQELNLLKRKLQARLGRRAGKIEITNAGISQDVTEPYLILQQQGEGWNACRGFAARDGKEPLVLQRAHRLIELLAWCHFNGLCGSQTAISVWDRNGNAVDSREIRRVMAQLREWFPDIQLVDAGAALSQPPTTATCALFVNLGIDPLASLSQAGLQRTTHRTNALSFSGLWENLAVALDVVALNTWQEVTAVRHEGPDALMDALCAHLNQASGRPSPEIYVQGFPGQRGERIAERVRKLFEDATQCFCADGEGGSPRYIIAVARGFYLLERDEEGYGFQRIASRSQLFERLGAPRARFSPIRLDQHTLDDTPVPTILAQNRPGAVQLFYQFKPNRLEVFVLDEKGSLFHRCVSCDKPSAALNQYQRFLRAAVARRRMVACAVHEEATAYAFDCYQIVGDHGEFRVESRALSEDHAATANYLSVEVITTNPDSGSGQTTVYCNGREFSSLDHGEGVFEQVVHHILRHRANGELYPVYITDLDIGARHEGEVMPQTARLLRYKERIEQRLNQALEQLAGSPDRATSP